MTRVLALIAMLFAGPVQSLSAQAVGQVGIPLGSAAPSAEIETIDGEPVDLGQFVGRRPMLLEFWATWCSDCEALQAQMNAAHERYGDRVEFLVIAVAVGQSKRAVRRHAEREHLGFDFLWDTRGRATRAYLTPTTSYVVAVNASGFVTYTGVGPDQNIEEAIATALESEGER